MNNSGVDWRATALTAALHGVTQLAGLGLLVAIALYWGARMTFGALAAVVFLLPLLTRVVARVILGLPHRLELWRAWAVILFCFVVAACGEGFAEAGVGPWPWVGAMGFAAFFGGMASSWPRSKSA